jgi:general secretion pathway protein N
MPASLSRKREPDRLFWPIVLFALLVLVVVVIIALPASLVGRFVPPPLHAEGFTGSLWHGSAARVSIDSRPVGALEWRLHPLALLSSSVVADLHWVKASTVIDGSVALDHQGFVAHGVHGGGPIEDLRDLGVAPGWHGNTTLDIREIKGSFNAISSAAGSIDVSGLSSSSVAAGADLGSYRVDLAPDASNPGSISATIEDTGGPLEARGEIHYTPASHLGLLSGTVRERPEASQALRNELTNLTQLKPRDGAGRIPIDIEFAM